MSNVVAAARLENAAYAAAKEGLLGVTKVLAIELAAHRIRVNAISPGSTRTELMDTYDEEMLEGILRGSLEKYRIGIPLGRFADPPTTPPSSPSSSATPPPTSPARTSSPTVANPRLTTPNPDAASRTRPSGTCSGVRHHLQARSKPARLPLDSSTSPVNTRDTIARLRDVGVPSGGICEGR